jgi:hypothetical protein
LEKVYDAGQQALNIPIHSLCKKKKDSTCYKLILVESLYFCIEQDSIMIEQVAKCRQDNNHSVQHIICEPEHVFPSLLCFSRFIVHHRYVFSLFFHDAHLSICGRWLLLLRCLWRQRNNRFLYQRRLLIVIFLLILLRPIVGLLQETELLNLLGEPRFGIFTLWLQQQGSRISTSRTEV